MSSNKDIGWMYEGAKSSVNREDYLLGKTIDKNFEKYSDAVITQKEDHIEKLIRGRGAEAPKISSISLDVMRTEDPLVALKVKEESRRRDVLENPLTKLKFQKFLKEAMEKKKKGEEKKKKKKRRKEQSSSDESETEVEQRRRKKEKKQKRAIEHSSKDEKRRSDDPVRDKKKISKGADDYGRKRIRDADKKRESSSDSHLCKWKITKDAEKCRDGTPESKKRRARKESTRHCSRDSDEKRSSKVGRAERRRDSSSPDYRNPRSEQRPKESRERTTSTIRISKEDEVRRRRFDSHIPSHLIQHAGSSSEDEEPKKEFDREEKAKKDKFAGFGLILGKKKDKKEEEEETTSNPYKLVKIPNAYNTVPEAKVSRPPLTEDEKQQKLKEMQDNAKWRDDKRRSHLSRESRKDEEEEAEEAEGKPATFIRGVLHAVSDKLTMEGRIQANKKNLQSTHSFMNNKFNSH